MYYTAHAVAVITLAWLASRHRNRDLDVKRGLMLPNPLHFRGNGK